VTELYDRIGVGYSGYRRPDPRIAAAITSALGGAKTVVNVGAGTGSYEPQDRRVVAVEPSGQMIRQRSTTGAQALRASGVELPFADDSFHAALAILTLHHWPDWSRGVGEMARVARDTVVILTWDPAATSFWLLEYFPEIIESDRRIFPTMDAYGDILGAVEIEHIHVPRDCSDGFLGAYWCRPEAYLDPGVRRAISAFARIREVAAGVERLRSDLADGTWERRYGDALPHDALDLGYRLVTASSARR
jgi:SAM-dependent methyltransferase